MTHLQENFIRCSKENEETKKEAIKNSEKDRKKQRQIIASGLLFTFGALVFAGNTIYLNQKQVQLNIRLSKEKKDLYDQYAYCPIEKGRPGEKVGKDVCFRDLITSGEKNVFLSSTNFHLEKGIKAFKNGKYDEAKLLFKQAMDSGQSDPIPKIFLNNTNARNARRYGKSSLRLAVVASIDYYEIAAKEVLRGVAEAQDEFNNKPENQSQLLEIVIANDENQPEAARKVAQELVNSDVLGVIGHHSSESTIAAQKIYQQKNMPIISPTSSSSEIKGNQFFRTVGNTKEAAKKYALYIRKSLEISKTVVFYKTPSKYSEVLMRDFTDEYLKQGGTVLKKVDIGTDTFNIESEVKKVLENLNIKSVLIMSDVQTNSIALAINKVNTLLPSSQRLQLFGAMSLSENETLEKGGKNTEGMILVRPCLLLALKPKHKSQDNEHKNEQIRIDWRSASSYDATQAFAEAIKLSKKKISRKEILRQLQKHEFFLAKEKTSGFGLKWNSEHSNANRKYCVVQIKNNKFVEIQEDYK
jgi:ABC-type branched-subunit amino acid transport system substrate-binding protein